MNIPFRGKTTRCSIKGIKVLFTPIVNLKTIAERIFFYNDMEKVE